MKERSAEVAPEANVPGTESALPLCISISIRCLKKKADFGSPESAARRRPNAETRSVAPNPQTPIVSITTGMEMCECERSEYLMILQLSAEDAAAPAVALVFNYK